MAVKPKRRTPPKTIIPKRKFQMFPDGAEREYTRLLSALFRKLTRSLMPKLKQLCKDAENKFNTDSRFDAKDDFEKWLKDRITEIAGDADDMVTPYQMTQMLSKVSKITQTMSLNSWMGLVQDAMGIELTGSYYDEVFADAKDAWIKENVSYIKSVPQNLLDKVQETITWGYDTHQPYINIYRRLQKLGMDYKTARRIARDQIGTLNAQMTRLEHESMGVEEYIWKTRKDDRVRECHEALEGTRHKWSDPPPMWYRTAGGIVYTGRYCHPSEDYGCRCTAIPVFDKDKAESSKGAMYGKDKPTTRRRRG